MTRATQPGITPPLPGQEKEEPDLWQEDDIPTEHDNKGTQEANAPSPDLEEHR